MRVGLLVNPSSGKGAGRRLGVSLRDELDRAGHALVDLCADSAAHAQAAAGAAVTRRDLDVLLVCGGDGTVNLGINVVAETGVPLAIAAAGTGNDIAAALGLPVRDAAATVALLEHGHRRHIDAGRVTSADGVRWFGGVLGAGFDAKVVDRANAMSWPAGRMRYNVALLRELRVFRPIPYAITVDERRVVTDAMLVAVANAPTFGGGMRVCPDAVIDDGLFDVLIVHRLPLWEFLRVFPQVYAGRHVHHRAVEILRGRRVHLDAELVSQADGERYLPLPLDIAAVPAAVRVVVPPRAESVGPT